MNVSYLNQSIFTLCLLVTILFCSGVKAANVQPWVSAANTHLSVTQIKADVALLKEAYERVHPGYLRYSDQSTLNSAWQALIDRAEANKGLSLGDFYLGIQKTLTLIRCDHTKANLPKIMQQERDTFPLYLPVRWTWLEGRAFVTQAAKETDLKIYDEILLIDGQPVESLVEQVLPFIPYDGYTEWSRLSGVSESLEFKGGALDHFGSLLWDNKPQVKMQIRRLDGEVKNLELTRINHKQWTALAGENASFRNFKDAVHYESIGENVAYLRIDTFVNYREPVSPEEIYRPIFKQIKQQKQNILILDLRLNGGGSSDASLGLFAHLLQQNTQAKLDMRVKTLDLDGIREHLWTWDKRALEPSRIGFRKNDDGSYSLRSWLTDELDDIEPAKYAFDGKIIALTSRNNSSGSTNILANLQSSGRATMLGEKTGGSAEGVTAGVLFTLTLPDSKITTRIPFFQYQNNVQNFEKGMGVVPDIKVSNTVESYLAGIDPILQRALAVANDWAAVER